MRSIYRWLYTGVHIDKIHYYNFHTIFVLFAFLSLIFRTVVRRDDDNRQSIIDLKSER